MSRWHYLNYRQSLYLGIYKHSSQVGFTLIELIMTLVVVGIISTTALPKLFDVKVYQQRTFYDDTLNALRYAQKLAIGSACNVQFSITGNQFSLMLPNNRNNCTSTNSASFTRSIVRPGSGEASYTGSLAGITLSDMTLYFVAKGNASSNATINIGSGQITVVQDTGFVYGTPP